MIKFSILCGCAYLLGSVNFAILLSSVFGYPDPRQEGSQNPGATNVLRVANSKVLAIAVLLGDLIKGWLPVFISGFVFSSKFNMTFVGLFAFIGHLYPVFFNFKGGKGVATYIGILLALYYPVALVFCAIWILVAMVTRYSSLASISAVVLSPVYLLFLQQYDMLVPILLMVGLLVLKHKANISRLQAGTESKLRFRDKF